MSTDKPRVLVSAEEEADISRMLMIWINTFSDEEMLFVNYEFLAADSAGMALSTIPGTYITRRYILGGHEAEYQFKIIARITPRKRSKQRKALERRRASQQARRLGDGKLPRPRKEHPRPACGDRKPRGDVCQIRGRDGRSSNSYETDI